MSFYSILLALTLFFTKETPISIWPYPTYFNLDSPEFSRGTVLSQSQNSGVEGLEIKIDSNEPEVIANLSYSLYSSFQNSSFKHSKNYFLPTFFSKIMSNLVTEDTHDSFDFTYVFPIYLFFSVPINIFLLSLVIIWIFQTNNSNELKKNLIIFFILSILFILGFLRIIFNFGYPESYIGTPSSQSTFSVLKGVVGPAIAAQGHIGIWGIEPRNISMLIGTFSVLFLFLGSGYIKVGFFLISLSLLTSTSQGLIFTFPFLFFLLVNRKNYKLLLYFCFLIIVLFIHMLSDSIINLYVIFFYLIFIYTISTLDYSNLKFLPRRIVNSLIFWYISSYLIVLAITYKQEFLLYLDSIFLNSLPFSKTEFFQGSYGLWGRGFLQEYPGRVGTLVLVLLLYRISSTKFIDTLIQLPGYTKIRFSKSLTLISSFIILLLINISIYTRITSML